MTVEWECEVTCVGKQTPADGIGGLFGRKVWTRWNREMGIASKHGMSEGWICLGRTRSASAMGKFSTVNCVSERKPGLSWKFFSTSMGAQLIGFGVKQVT